jgi:uncharacterized iron-regulated membrane protein
MKRFKKVMGTLHLWLGLASGLVVFVVALTGALLTFEEEIEYHIISPGLWLVDQQPKPPLPVDSLMRLATPELLKLAHGQKASRVFLFNDPGRSVVVGFNYTDAASENHRGHVFLNPYNGQLLGSRTGNPHHPVWQTLTDIHINLLLGELGSALVTWGTLVFLIMVLSGLVLWWPKNKSAAKQRVWFRWQASSRWKRKNYDLHNILGFYACWVVLFMIVTGAMWAFDWFNNGVYFIMSGGKTLQTSYEESIRPAQKNSEPKVYPIEPAQYAVALTAFKQRYPAIYQSATEVDVGYFANEKDSLMDVAATFDPKGIRGQKTMWAFFDKTTNRIVRDNSDNIKNFGDAVQMSTNELHYGTFFGMTSKLLTFLACLIAASLPISGFYIWYGRRRKPAQHVRSVVVKPRPRRPNSRRPNYIKNE